MKDRTEVLETALASIGRVNFREPCAVGATAALMIMTERDVALALDDATGTIYRAPFSQATVSGDGLIQHIRLGIDTVAVTFDSNDSLERVVRVLNVRKSLGTTTPAVVGTSGGYIRPAVPGAPLGNPSSPAEQHQRWATYVMWASTFLLTVAWLDLAAGVVAALILFANNAGAIGLIALLLAAAGCAMPLCLGALARMTVYRDRALASQS